MPSMTSCWSGTAAAASTVMCTEPCQSSCMQVIRPPPPSPFQPPFLVKGSGCQGLVKACVHRLFCSELLEAWEQMSGFMAGSQRGYRRKVMKLRQASLKPSALSGFAAATLGREAFVAGTCSSHCCSRKQLSTALGLSPCGPPAAPLNRGHHGQGRS